MHIFDKSNVLINNIYSLYLDFKLEKLYFGFQIYIHNARILPVQWRPQVVMHDDYKHSVRLLILQGGGEKN